MNKRAHTQTVEEIREEELRIARLRTVQNGRSEQETNMIELNTLGRKRGRLKINLGPKLSKHFCTNSRSKPNG